MKALSVRQPWASMIVRGFAFGECHRFKTIELRSWPTSHVGPLLICSSKAPFDWPAKWDEIPVPDLPRGVALGIVDVVACRPFVPADARAAVSRWAANLWAWELENPRALYEPFAVRGQQQLFEVDVKEFRLDDPRMYAPAVYR